MTQIDDATTSQKREASWRDFGAWLYGRRLVLSGWVLVAAQTAVSSFVLSRGFFQQDDFAIAGLASRSLSWHLLFQNYGGHLMPGVFALTWLLIHNGVGYDWGLWCGLLVAVQALAGLALLRSLRTLCGDRMLILVPLAVFACSPLVMTDLSWWAAGVQAVPLLLALALAVDQHVRYLRTGQFRNAVFAACWIAAGLAFNEKASAIPVLLLALTAAFPLTGGVAGRWQDGLASTLRRHWHAWVLYAGLLVAEVIVYLLSLLASTARPVVPAANTAVAFSWDLLRNTFVPGALGGPWRWAVAPGADRSWALTAYAATPATLLVLSWCAAAAVVLASLWYRSHAGRAWSILLGWLILVDIGPVVTGRVATFGTLAAASEWYLTDAMVVAMCLAIAVLPLRDEADPYRVSPRRRRRRVLAAAPAVLAAAALVTGGVWSAGAYRGELHPGKARSYFATASAALAAVPPDSVIYRSQLPSQLAWHVFGTATEVENALAPLVSQVSGERFQWSSAPAGTVSSFLIFDSQGRLHQVAVIGPYSLPFRKQSQCYLGTADVRLQLTATVIPVPLVLRLGYFSPHPVTLAVTFGARTYQLALRPSPLAYGYLPVLGAGNAVDVRSVTPGSGICISSVTIGNVTPWPDQNPVPVKPVRA